MCNDSLIHKKTPQHNALRGLELKPGEGLPRFIGYDRRASPCVTIL
jgi:hypothetical protein